MLDHERPTCCTPPEFLKREEVGHEFSIFIHGGIRCAPTVKGEWERGISILYLLTQVCLFGSVWVGWGIMGRCWVGPSKFRFS